MHPPFFAPKRQNMGEDKALPAPPHATALLAQRENKRLRSDNGVSVVGLDIFFFQNLDSFWEFIFR